MVHRTMQGKLIDMEKLARQNELMPAIGNMKVNARGDELGPGGKIIRKREEVVADYYENNPKARVQQAAPQPAAEPQKHAASQNVDKHKKTQTGE